jgi:hypothetical protein
MNNKKDTKKMQEKQKKKTRKNQTNKRKTKKECCKIGSGRTFRKRRRNQKTCAICLEKIRYADLIYTECKHPFHIECLEAWCATNRSKRTVPCPYCRHPINGTCSEIYQVNYETQFEIQGETIPPMVDIPRWYTGDVFAQIQTPPYPPPDDSPIYNPGTPEDSSPMSISTIIHFTPRTPSESPPSRFSSLSANSSIDPLNDIEIYDHRPSRPFLTIEDLRVDDREPPGSDLESIFIPSSPEYSPPSPPFLTMEDLRVDEPQRPDQRQ